MKTFLLASALLLAAVGCHNSTTTSSSTGTTNAASTSPTPANAPAPQPAPQPDPAQTASPVSPQASPTVATSQKPVVRLRRPAPAPAPAPVAPTPAAANADFARALAATPVVPPKSDNFEGLSVNRTTKKMVDENPFTAGSKPHVADEHPF